MIHVIDLFSAPGIHDRVNRALLEAFEGRELTFWGNPDILENYQFQAYPFRVGVYNSFMRLFYRDLFLPLKCLSLLFLKIQQSDTIIISGFSRPQIITLLPTIFFFSFYCNVSVLFHSQLEVFDDQKSTNLFKSIYLKTITAVLALFLKRNSIRKLVLGHHIKKNLQIVTSVNALEAISHPFSKADVVKVSHRLLGESAPSCIGTFGLLRNDTKFSSGIYSVAKRNSDLHFMLIGRKGPGFNWAEVDNVINVPISNVISECELETLLAAITHFIYFFPLDKYKFTASGSALDAIIQAKGVIISENEALRDAVEGYAYVSVISETLRIEKDRLKSPTSLEDLVNFVEGRRIAPSNKEIYEIFEWWTFSNLA